MNGGAFSTQLIDCNHQLAISFIYDTQIAPGVLQLASPNEGEGLVGLLD